VRKYLPITAAGGQPYFIICPLPVSAFFQTNWQQLSLRTSPPGKRRIVRFLHIQENGNKAQSIINEVGMSAGCFPCGFHSFCCIVGIYNLQGKAAASHFPHAGVRCENRDRAASQQNQR